jgi:hypothetical protein
MVTQRRGSTGSNKPKKNTVGRGSLSDHATDCVAANTTISELETLSLDLPHVFTDPLKAVRCPDCETLCFEGEIQYHCLNKHIDMGVIHDLDSFVSGLATVAQEAQDDEPTSEPAQQHRELLI